MRSWSKHVVVKKKTLLQIIMAVAAIALLLPLTITSTLAYADGSFTITQDEIDPRNSSVTRTQRQQFSGGVITNESAPAWLGHSFSAAYIVDTANRNKKIQIKKAELRGANVVVIPTDDYNVPDGITLQYAKNDATNIHFEYYQDAVAIPVTYNNNNNNKVTVDGPYFVSKSPATFNVTVSAPRNEKPTLVAYGGGNSGATINFIADISSPTRTAYLYELQVTKATRLIADSEPKPQLQLTDSGSRPDDWKSGGDRNSEGGQLKYANTLFDTNSENYHVGDSIDFNLYHDRVKNNGDFAYTTSLAAVYLNGIPVPAPQPLARYGASKYRTVSNAWTGTHNYPAEPYSPYYDGRNRDGRTFKEDPPSYVVGTFSQAQGWDPNNHASANEPHDSYHNGNTWRDWWNKEIKTKVIGQKTETTFKNGPLAGSTVTITITDALPAAACNHLSEEAGTITSCPTNTVGRNGWGFWNPLRLSYHVHVSNVGNSLRIDTEWANSNNIKVGVRLNYGVENVQVRAQKTGYNGDQLNGPNGQQPWVNIGPGGDWIDGKSLEGTNCNRGYTDAYYESPCAYINNNDPQISIKGEVPNGYRNPVFIDGSHAPVQGGDPLQPLTIYGTGFEGRYPIFATGVDNIDGNQKIGFGGMSIIGVQAERLTIPLGFDLNGGSAAQKDSDKFPTVGQALRNVQYSLDPEIHPNARIPLVSPIKNHLPLKHWKLQYIGTDTGRSFTDTGKIFKPGSLVDIYDTNAVGRRINDKGGTQQVTAFRLQAVYEEGGNSADANIYSINLKYKDGSSETTENLLDFNAVKGVNVVIDRSKLPAEKQKNGKKYKRAIKDAQLNDELTVTVGDTTVVKTFVYDASTQADETNPEAQLITVNLKSTPGNAEAKSGIKMADSLGARTFEFVSTVNTSKPTELLTPAPQIKITYNDGSVDLVNAKIKVIDNRDEATKWNEDQNNNQGLTANNKTFDYGHTVTDDDRKGLITQGSTLPSNATVSLNTPIDTSPTDQNHYDQQRTLTVTFSDRSTLTVQVTPHIKTAAETFDPQAQSPQVSVRYNATIGATEAQNAVNTNGLPSGTSYGWASGHKPDTSSAGSKAGQVTVTYPDTTTDTVPVNVTVRDSASVTGVPETALPGSTFTPNLVGAESGETYTLKLCAATDQNCSTPLEQQQKSASQNFDAVTIPKTSAGTLKVVVTDSTGATLPVQHTSITLTPVELTAKDGGAVASSVQAGSAIDAKLKNPAVSQDYVVKLCKQSDTNCSTPVAKTTTDLNTASPNVDGLTIPLNTDSKADPNNRYQLKLYRKDCARNDDRNCTPAVVKEITATIGAADLSDKAHSNFAVTKTGATNVANNSDSYTVTITLKDSKGNAVKGAANKLHLSQSGIASGVTINSVSEKSDQPGVYTATITSTKAGSGTVSVLLDSSSVLLKQGASDAITFVAGPVDLGHSMVEVTQNNQVANGSAQDSYKVTLKDANDNPVSGMSSKIDSSISGLTNTTINTPTDNSDGTYTVTVTSTKAGTGSVTVKFKNMPSEAGTQLSGSPLSLTFIPGEPAHATLQGGSSSISGQKNQEIGSPGTLLVTDAQGNPVAQGTHVYITVPGDSSVHDVTVGANGVATIPAFTPDNNGAVKVYKENSKATEIGNVPVTVFVGDADLDNNAHSNYRVTLTQSGQNVANGVDSYTVTITLKDSSENPVTGKASQLTLAQSGIDSGRVTISAISESGTSGVYTATIKSTKIGTGNVTVTLMQNQMQKDVKLATSASKEVTFVAGEPASVEFAGVPGTVNSGNEYCTSDSCTITVKDAQGNPVAKGTKVFVTLPGASSPVAVTIGDNGVASLPSFTPATIADNKVTVFKGQSDNAEAADVSGGKIGEEILTVQPGDPAHASGDAISTVKGSQVSGKTVRITDAAGNTVTGGTVYVKVPGSSDYQEVMVGSDGSATIPSFTAADNTPVKVYADNAGKKEIGTVTVTIHIGDVDLDNKMHSNYEVVEPYANKHVANGSDYYTVIIKLADINGNPVSERKDDLTIEQAGIDSGVVISEIEEHTTGTYRAFVTSTKSGTGTITVKLNEKGEQKSVMLAPNKSKTVLFIAGDPAAAHSSLTLNPTNPITGSMVSISGVVKDAQGNPVPSREVTLLLPNGSTISATTNDSGQLTAKAPATVLQFAAGVPRVQETVKLFDGTQTTGDPIASASETPRVDPMKAGVPVVQGEDRSTASIDSAEVLADGTATHTVTVVLKDVYGDAVTGAADKLSLATSSADFTDALGLGNFTESDTVPGTYTATVTSTLPGNPVLNVSYERNTPAKQVVINNDLVAKFKTGPYDASTSTLVLMKDAATVDTTHPVTAGDSVDVVFTPKDAQGHVLKDLTGPVTVTVPGIEDPVTLVKQDNGTWTASTALTVAGDNTITSTVQPTSEAQPTAGPSATVKVNPASPSATTSTVTLTPEHPTEENGSVPIEGTDVVVGGVVKDQYSNKVLPDHNLTVVVTDPDGSKRAIPAKTDSQGNIVDRTTGMPIKVTVGEAGEVTTVEVFDGDVDPNAIPAGTQPISSANVTAGKDPSKIGVPVFEGKYAAVASVTTGSKLADGTEQHVVTVVLKDKYGVPVSGKESMLGLVKADGIDVSLGSFTAKDGQPGVYEAPVTSTVVGTAHVNAMYNTNTAVKPTELQVLFAVGDFSAEHTTITVSKSDSDDAVHTVTAGDQVTITVVPKDAQDHPRTIPGDPETITVNVPGVEGPVVLTKDDQGRYVGTATPVKVTTPDTNKIAFPEDSPLKDRTYELNVNPAAPNGMASSVVFGPEHPAPGEDTSVRVVVRDQFGNPVAAGVRVNVVVPGSVVRVPGVTDADGVVHPVGEDGAVGSGLPVFAPVHAGSTLVRITVGDDDALLKKEVLVVRPHVPVRLKANSSGVTGMVHVETAVGSTVTVRNAQGEIVATGEVVLAPSDPDDPDSRPVKVFKLAYDEGVEVQQDEQLQVTVTDLHTALTSNQAGVLVDLRAPAKPSIVLDAEQRTLVSGVVDPADGTPVKKVTVCVTPAGETDAHCVEAEVVDGKYSAVVPELHDGDVVEVTVENEQGNASSSSRVVDFTAPDAPVDLDVSNDGSTVTGKGEPGAVVRVTLPDGSVVEGVVGEDGEFEVVLPDGVTVPDGGEVIVVLVDDAGNVSDAGVVVADRSNGLSDVVVSDDGGVVSGKTDPGSSVTVRGEDGRVVGAGVADQDGNFTITINKLTKDTHITVTSVDPHGNTARAELAYIAPKKLSNTGSNVSQLFGTTVLLTIVGAFLALKRRKESRKEAEVSAL